MEDFNKKYEDGELSCSLAQDGVIHIAMHGNISEDHIEGIREWVDSVHKAMYEASEQNSENVLTLIDATGLTETDSASAKILQELMKHNKKYATRTAVFGAGFFHTLIVETALKITHRENMKLFKTRDEAMEWLRIK